MLSVIRYGKRINDVLKYDLVSVVTAHMFLFVLSLALKYSKKRLEIRGGSRTV